ncbi:endo-1,4-beta-xylanase [Aquipuribacter sp. SD81]|uniref:endo-1,4-beta-xylanase n=1 Tax=Aquipuribacter sp. SD81 TaxID=3127703 RepID=UPI00301AD95E
MQAPAGAAAAEDPQVLVATDFEDGTTGPWVQNGDATLQVVDGAGEDGGRALLVSGRANDYDGVKSPGGLLAPGETYTFSARARLADGTAGSAGVRFVVEPAYTWVGNTTMSAAAWTTVTGTYTVPADADTATQRVYLGTGALEGPYDYLLDDLVITGEAADGEPWEPTPDPDFVPGGASDPTTTPRAAARGTGDVVALTLDDGPNPGETEAVLDLLAAYDVTATFCVIGQTVTAPGGAEILRRIVAEGHTLCNHSTSYADMGAFTQAQVEADLKANLAIIREALGDPDAPVPYFRAPNGSWGVTGEVAAALGMQPLGLGNVIFDWDGNDLSVPTLTANLREAWQPGAVVLVHDGGGDRSGTVAALETVLAEKVADGWTFSLPVGGAGDDPDGEPGGPVGPGLSTSFEDGLDGWVPRGDADGDPTVAVTTDFARTGAQSALVSGRTTQGDGIGRDVTGLMTTGTTYEVSAWVRFAPGATPDDVWLSVQRTGGGATSYDTVGQFSGVTASDWTQVTATYQVPAADSLFLYLETRYPDGSAGSFLVDDVTVTPQDAPEVQDLTPLKETVPFPVGVAIDERETTGAAAELLTRHFDQVSHENHMKPEAFYAGDGPDSFRLHPQAQAVLDFAAEEDLRVYGHVLVWHSQTPAWFFTAADGSPLTTSEADKELLRQRMRTHVFSVAEVLAERYGAFGSDTNPLVAWDVVNEVISDSGEFSDGMRRSEWYRVLGEEFVDLAFAYADEAFNDVYAAEGTDRPVALFINDYNTEQLGKQGRYRALVERLLARGVPLDGVGHQFHVSLSVPVQALEDAIVRFEDLPVQQAVTELDVTTGTPETQARFVDQGYYYRDAFRIFREHADSLYSVTVWGLTDGRSWRAANGGPLLFDDALQAKPAFYGAADLDLPQRQRTAVVFAEDVPLAGALDAATWDRLPLLPVEQAADFQLRWGGDALTVYAEVADTTVDGGDAVEVAVGESTWRVARDGTVSGGDGGSAVTGATDDGWRVALRVPLAAAQGDTVAFDLRVLDGGGTDGGTVTGWNEPGTLGTLTLVEPLSFARAVEATTAPVVDGEVDDVWSSAEVVTTDTQVSGSGGATAEVRTLWQGQTLYVLAEVSDPVLDATGSDPWQQDSVELFVDAGNVRNGPYRYDDTQIRISYENTVSFGTGDEGFQANRLDSATSVVDGGYVVEASVGLLESGGLGTFHGFDVQVNDAADGARTGIRSWADPTGLGYQTTSRWGVLELVAAPEDPDPDPEPEPEPEPDASLVVGDWLVAAGDHVTATLSGAPAGATAQVRLVDERGRRTTTVPLGTVVVGADGTAEVRLRVPAGTALGRHDLVAEVGDVVVVADHPVVVRASSRGGGRGPR